MSKTKAIRAKDMVYGRLYYLASDKSKTVFEYQREGAKGWIIVNPPGEPDTQSSSAIKENTAVVESQ
jgi:hypothetical protein